MREKLFTLIILSLIQFPIYSQITEKGDTNSVNKTLKAITIKSLNQLKEEDPIKVEVIDIKKFKDQSSTLIQLMNQTSGVKIRQSSGVGSETSININGLQGRAIRFFKDGIPMDYLGNAFDLSLIPIDQISTIEIYKGVLPVELGADALGGAVNIRTSTTIKNYLSSSITVGSFNNYQFNLNTLYQIPKTNIYTGVSGYYVNAKNNYPFEGKIIDPFTQNLKDATVSRFHDGILSSFLEFKLGLQKNKFSDFLEVNYSIFDREKEYQNGLVLSQPIGEAKGNERSNILNLSYSKKINKIDIKAFAAFSKVDLQITDTSSNRYDWNGNITSTGNTTGEIKDYKTLMEQNTSFFTSRLLLTYEINKNHVAQLSSTYNYSYRIGADKLGGKSWINGEDPLTIPSYYHKNIIGIGLTSSFLGDKVKNILTGKYYQINTESVDPWYAKPTHTKLSKLGFGEAIKYSFTEFRFLRASYELTTRIPDAFEFFGDNLFVLPNPDLKEEQSHNYNLNFNTNITKSNSLSCEINLFYRHTQNFIQQRSVGIFFSRYENTDDAAIKGVETNILWKGWKNLVVNCSFTLQDLRRINTESSSKALENSRISNVPYLFANVSVRKDFPKFFKDSVKASVYANYGFTEQFLLYPVPQNIEPTFFQKEIAYTDQIIPMQQQVDIGFTLTPQKYKLTFNIELLNCFNQTVYDSFRIQKPGRFLRLKINYRL